MSSNLDRRNAARLLIAAAALAVVGGPAVAAAGDHREAHEDDEGCDCSLRHGKIFISTNAAAGNEVLVYRRNSNGPATLLQRFATQGHGTGAGLGSQGAVTLSGNGRFLFVVNAGSNTVSTFVLGNSGLELKSVVDSGGLMPTSVTEHEGLVYVLNAGGSGGVVGFRNVQGTLLPVPGGSGTLSANTGTAPGQVGFSSDGNVLVVTERATSRLTTFLVRQNGTLDQKTVTPAAGSTPFGFAFTRRDYLVVSEAASGSASSYRFDERSATPQLLTAAAPSTQGAPCWVAVTPNGKFAFTANAGSSSISSFHVASNGQLSLRAAQAGLTGANAGALDLVVTPHGGQLHIFASRGLQIVSFAVTHGGGLVPLGSVGGMPAGSAGLAVN